MEEHRLQECPQKWVLAILFFECHQSGHVFFCFRFLWASCGFIIRIRFQILRCPLVIWVCPQIHYTSTIHGILMNNTNFLLSKEVPSIAKKATSGEKCLPLTSLGLKFRCLFYLSWVLLKHLSFISVSTWTGPKSTRDVPGTPAELLGSWGYFIKTKDGALWPARRSPAYSSGRPVA